MTAFMPNPLGNAAQYLARQLQDATGGVLGLAGSSLVRRGLGAVKGLAVGLYEEFSE